MEGGGCIRLCRIGPFSYRIPLVDIRATLSIHMKQAVSSYDTYTVYIALVCTTVRSVHSDPYTCMRNAVPPPLTMIITIKNGLGQEGN